MPKYLVITGGSRGIGEKTIQRFQEDNWSVINISRSLSPLPNVTNCAMDLSSTAEIEAKSKAVLEILKDAHEICLVHNAAFYKPDSVDSFSLENLQKSLQTNVIAPALLNKILLPRMSAGSSILYIGSTLAEKAVRGSASYVMSKHALIGLMKATCQDLKGKDIHTCCICPGLVDTQLLRETIDAKSLQYLLEHKVIGKRLIDPAEIAEVIHFCAKSKVINGATIHANLGVVE